MRRRVMPSITPMSWDQKRQSEIDEFVGRCDWDAALRQWHMRVEQFGIDLNPLFLTVTVHDPGSPEGREPALSWWPTRSIDKLREECLNHFARWPGSRGPIHASANYTRQGEIDTLAHLWACKDRPDKIAAILIAGSLFSRIESRRPQHHALKWPSYPCVRVLQDWAYECWRDPGTSWGWHPSSTSVIPVMSEDWTYQIDSMTTMVRYLAEEHAALLSTHRPVVIEYRPTSGAQLRSV